MAARLTPGSVSAHHQSLLQLVGQSPCSAEAMLSPAVAFCSAVLHPRRCTNVMISILSAVAGLDNGVFLFIFRGHAPSGELGGNFIKPVASRPSFWQDRPSIVSHVGNFG